MKKSEEEWKEQLSPEEFRILREKGTEPPFSGKFHKHKEEGVYTCAGCENQLFSSENKYESGTGWPSFYKTVKEDGVETKEDRSHGMHRTEVLCSECGGHLGHVFDDGPQPTRKRYCINSAALKFVDKENAGTEKK